MAATPEAPMSLLVMLLERCTEQVREYLNAQQFPEAEPAPSWNGPLMPGPSAGESPPDLAPATLPSAPTPPQHYIPAPVGERHHRRISQDVKIAVSARDGGRCRQCGSTEKLHFDHIIPVSKGGANTIANIQLLCASCNRSKAAKYPK